MCNKVILFSDNNVEFLSTRAEYLSDTYTVLKASTPAEAARLMRTRRIHVAIIDIRMEDDGDENDISGLQLAKHDSFRNIPTIILSSYGTREQIAEVLAPALEGLPPAVDFVDKNANVDQMLEAIEKAFIRHVRCNWELAIHFGKNLSSAHLATLVTEPNDPFLMDRAGEIEDLLRRRFADYTQINVSRILTQGSCVINLDVAAFNQADAERQYLVSLGQLDSIKAEQQRYRLYAPSDGGIGDTLRIGDTFDRTAHLGLSVYSLAGNRNQRVEPLLAVFQSRPIDNIHHALDNLYGATLARWQHTGRFDKTTESLVRGYCPFLSINYDELTHASQEWIEAMAAEIQRTGLGRILWTPDELTLELNNGQTRSWINPIWSRSAEVTHGDHTLHSGFIHGNVTVSTVMVNPLLQTWLIDFSRAGKGPLALDFISLELSLRYQMAGYFDLTTRIQLEETLFQEMDSPGDLAGPHDLPAEAQKELETIRYIRQMAMQTIHHNQTSYLAGVYCYALYLLQRFEINRRYSAQELMPLLHIFVVLTMTLDRLARCEAEPRDALTIDVNTQSVRVGEHEIELTPQEFDILRYLYQHAGQLRTKEQILADAMHTAEMDEQINTSRFNSAISRLRQKIEKDTRKPRYIFNVRGRGYRLEL